MFCRSLGTVLTIEPENEEIVHIVNVLLNKEVYGKYSSVPFKGIASQSLTCNLDIKVVPINSTLHNMDIVGVAERKCDMDGMWEATIMVGCVREEISQAEQDVSN